jgi:ABC-type multidrug transport system ATPase subunit
MQPSVLILDEPMGGLDPVGRRDLLAALSTLRSHAQEHPVTIVMAESDPEAVGAFADRLVILENGHLVLDGPPKALFQRPVELAKFGVSVPQMALVADAVNQNLGTSFEFLTIDEAKASLAVHLA